MRYFGPGIFAALLFILGVKCLKYARVVQANAAAEAAHDERKLRFIRSPQYLWAIRSSGVVALLMALLVVASLMFGKPAQ
jgi:hypothetical protein